MNENILNSDSLVTENLGLVHLCVRRFLCRGIEYDDLYQAGCLGLVKAAGNFDPQRGVRFSTYAVPAILGEIRRMFRDGGSVRVSRGLRELAVRIQRTTSEWQERTGRPPTVDELAAALEVTPERAALAMGALRQPVSLTAGEEGEQMEIPVDAPEDGVTERLALKTLLDRLEEKDRQLILCRYFQGMTQARTGEQLGMSQVQVSRREKKLLGLLRQELTAER